MVNIYNWCEVQDYCPNLDQRYNLISSNDYFDDFYLVNWPMTIA